MRILSLHHFIRSSLGAMLCIALPALASNVPVIDLSQNGQVPQQAQESWHQNVAQAGSQAMPTVNTESLSLPQRITRLERQMNNWVQMDLPNKISKLQERIQQMSGQLEVAAHNLNLLKTQQRNFYQDIDQRLQNLEALVNGNKNLGKTDEEVKNETSHKSKHSKNLTSNQEQAYQAAFQLLTTKQYKKSVVAFLNYLSNYPQGQYVVNAHYWLGEIYSQQGKNKNAISELETVVKQFPNSPKVPDSRLKLAIIHAQMGNHAEAKQELQKLIKQYPNTAAAKLAKLQLQQL